MDMEREYGRRHRLCDYLEKTSLKWTPEEKEIFERGRARYASDSPLTRYMQIASELPQKTTIDVACLDGLIIGNITENSKDRSSSQVEKNEIRLKELNKKLADFKETENIFRMLSTRLKPVEVEPLPQLPEEIEKAKKKKNKNKKAKEKASGTSKRSSQVDQNNSSLKVLDSALDDLEEVKKDYNKLAIGSD